jgi:amicyanin
MKKIVIALAVVVLVAIGAFALANSNKSENPTPEDSMSAMDNNNEQTQSQSQTETVAQDTVEIKDYAFGPANISVKAGTKVTWTNQDAVQHDVVSDEGVTNGPQSELLAKGDTYSFTFDKAGTYTYHCGPHPYMKGTVTVTE